MSGLSARAASATGRCEGEGRINHWWKSFLCELRGIGRHRSTDRWPWIAASREGRHGLDCEEWVLHCPVEVGSPSSRAGSTLKAYPRAGTPSWPLRTYGHVHENIYGTSLAAVEAVATKGQVCVLDIDVQGAEIVKKSTLDAVSYTHLTLPTIYSV